MKAKIEVRKRDLKFERLECEEEVTLVFSYGCNNNGAYCEAQFRATPSCFNYDTEFDIIKLTSPEIIEKAKEFIISNFQ